MREEDDDLLRAAEELGIDLTGVRSTDGSAADESIEHEGETVEASALELGDDEEVGDEVAGDLESGEELEEADFAAVADPMLDADVGPGEAEGVLEEDEA
jgi:DNA-directed RNA polymerase subunit beta